jgi:hypothetical protein
MVKPAARLLLVLFVCVFMVGFVLPAHAQKILWLDYDDFEGPAKSQMLWELAKRHKILWLDYDDFEVPAKSQILWELENRHMCDEHLSYFQDGKMFQEADVNWFKGSCYPNSTQQNRVRTNANAAVASYITGLAATLKVDTFVVYSRAGLPNNVRSRLFTIFYNDGVLTNDGSGQDMTSEIFTSIQVVKNQVSWNVFRSVDRVGQNSTNLASGVFLQAETIGLPSFDGIPVKVKLWFDGTKIYFSVQVEKDTGEIIELTSTYTPAGEILPPKSPPLKRLETLIDVRYLSPTTQPIDIYKDPSDNSYIKAEWDDVSVAVEPTKLGTVKRFIH